MENPRQRVDMDWSHEKHYPSADYLSSSRKRLAPQLIFKGGILHSWSKKMAVAVDQPFMDELPDLPKVPKAKADVAWLVYKLRRDQPSGIYKIQKVPTIYTKFTPALERITKANPGREVAFRETLQRKLRQKLAAGGTNRNTVTDLEEIF
jgi:hypothetical protein